MAKKSTKSQAAGGDRKKALDAAMAMIEKDYGKGAVMRLGDEDRPPIQAISSGNTAIDVALGIGGFPRGRVVEVYGPESSGKTTVALHAIASAQKEGGIAAFIDAEHALDPDYAKKLGVDTDNLLVSQPDTGEQALEIADMLVRSGAIDIIVIDSVAALTPKAEIEGEMGDSHVGLQARLMSQALRKMTGALYNSGTTAIFINQLREKIGVMFGSPETTTGGKALKFYSSVRLDVRRIQTLKDGQDAIGNRTRVKVVKNKVSPPFKIAEFDIMYGEGISRESSVIDLGVENGIVKKSGSWFTYEGDQLGQGKEKSRLFLKDNPDLADEIETKIFTKLGIGEHAAEESADDPALSVPGVEGEEGLSDDPVDMVPNVDFDDEDDDNNTPDPDKIARLREALEQYSPAEEGGLFDREAEEAKAQVRKRALGLLDQRARSREELRGRLIDAEFDPDVVDEVLDDLQRSRLLDDAAFAYEWVRQRHARRGKSARVLDRELREKGVAAALRAEALEQIDEADEEATARTFAEKKARSVKTAPVDREGYNRELRRVVGVLARRGFDGGMSMRLAREALDARIAELD